jgi:hypothetical protein
MPEARASRGAVPVFQLRVPKSQFLVCWSGLVSSVLYCMYVCMYVCM